MTVRSVAIQRQLDAAFMAGVRAQIAMEDGNPYALSGHCVDRRAQFECGRLFARHFAGMAEKMVQEYADQKV